VTTLFERIAAAFASGLDGQRLDLVVALAASRQYFHAPGHDFRLPVAHAVLVADDPESGQCQLERVRRGLPGFQPLQPKGLSIPAVGERVCSPISVTRSYQRCSSWPIRKTVSPITHANRITVTHSTDCSIGLLSSW
jgi:hypothetical protein